MPKKTPGTVLVGIGNPYRGDDAVGWAVIDALEGKLSADIQLSKQRGDIAQLIDIFANNGSVYIVDACCTNAPLGSWQRIDVHEQPLALENNQTSTHGFSISQGIELAKSLDQLPEKLIVYAITGSNYEISNTLSPQVAHAINEVVQAILNEEDIRTCTNMV